MSEGEVSGKLTGKAKDRAVTSQDIINAIIDSIRIDI
jgi:hypothetical protein